MQTSTKVIIGLAALCGLSLYSKNKNGSYNPLVLFSSDTGPGLPKTTPTPPALTQGSSPEVKAAVNTLQAVPASFPNSPEVQAAANVLTTMPPNSPEAKAAISLLSTLPTSPEAQAAINILQGAAATSFVPGENSPLIKNGDVVNVDMFRAGVNLPENLPLVGLLFMTVVSLEGPGDPTKFFATFVNPEFAIFGQQTVNRSAIVAKAA